MLVSINLGNGLTLTRISCDHQRQKSWTNSCRTRWILLRLMPWFLTSRGHQQLWYGIGYAGQIDGLVQDCSNSSALALELLQSCTKPSRWRMIENANIYLCFWKNTHMPPKKQTEKQHVEGKRLIIQTCEFWLTHWLRGDLKEILEK